MLNLSQIQSLLPTAVTLIAEWESLILRDGVELAANQLSDACRAGVSKPETVRVLCVEQLPIPTERHFSRDWITILQAHGIFAPTARGLTCGYGIFLRKDCA